MKDFVANSALMGVVGMMAAFALLAVPAHIVLKHMSYFHSETALLSIYLFADRCR